MTDAERIAELEHQLAYQKKLKELFMGLCLSWGTKNNELRRMLKDHGIVVSQAPEGL